MEFKLKSQAVKPLFIHSLIGCGGDLLVHSLGGDLQRGSELIAKTSVFDGYRVHGITSGKMPLSLPGVALAVHGDRMVKVSAW